MLSCEFEAPRENRLLAVQRQVIGVAVIIPQDFSASYLAGEKDVQVLIVSDPTLSIGPAVVEDMVTMMVDAVGGGGIAIQTVMERQQANGIQPDPAHFQTWAQRYGDCHPGGSGGRGGVGHGTRHAIDRGSGRRAERRWGTSTTTARSRSSCRC